jgi:hypothetical protein
MPHFYFDIDNGECSLRDEIGAEAENLIDVRNAAVCALPEMAKDVLPDGDHRIFAINVRDDNDRVIFRATLSFNAQWVRDDGLTH